MAIFIFFKAFRGCLRNSPFSDLQSFRNSHWVLPWVELKSPSQVAWPVWGPKLLSQMRCVCLSFSSCYGSQPTPLHHLLELASGTPVRLEALSTETFVMGGPHPHDSAWSSLPGAPLGPGTFSSSFWSTGPSNISRLPRFLGNPAGAT